MRRILIIGLSLCAVSIYAATKEKGIPDAPAAMHNSKGAPGDLDASFGKSGTVKTILEGDNAATGVVVQRDGKIVVVGSIGDYPNRDFLVARYRTDGKLDRSFGDHGIVVTDFVGGEDEAAGVALQRDNKIVVVGLAWDVPTNTGDFAIERLNTDGSPDPSFGDSGQVLTDLGAFDSGADFDVANAVAIQRNGKIVVVGRANGSTSTDMAVVRYDPDGRLDMSFGDGGIITTDLEPGVVDEAGAVALLRNGKIVVAATTGAELDFALVRYNRDGTLDDEFGDGGSVVTDFFGRTDVARGVAIQPNGRIVLVGTARGPLIFLFEYTADDFALARYLPDGSLDKTFGSDGKVTTDFFRGFDGAGSVALQRDGKIVAAGSAGPAPGGGDGGGFALARYQKDGALDLSFGTCGKVITRGNDFSFTGALAVALQEDGKIVAAGAARGATDSEYALARYLSGGEHDGHQEHNKIHDADVLRAKRCTMPPGATSR